MTFCNFGVIVIVAGENVNPPSVDLNTWLEEIISADFAPSPLDPVSPFLDLDQLNVLVNDFPSTVTGILNEPLSAKLVPVFAWIVMVVPLLLKVKPFTVVMYQW